MKTNEFVSLDEQKVGGVGNWLLRHGAFGKTRAVQAMAKYDTELQKKVGFIKWVTGLKQAFDGAVNSGQVKLSTSIAESISNYKDFDILLEQLISEREEISPSSWIKQFVSLYTKGQTLPSNYNSVIDNLAKQFEDEVTKDPKMKFDSDKGSAKKIYDFIYSIGLQQARDERGRIIPATGPATVSKSATGSATGSETEPATGSETEPATGSATGSETEPATGSASAPARPTRASASVSAAAPINTLTLPGTNPPITFTAKWVDSKGNVIDSPEIIATLTNLASGKTNWADIPIQEINAIRRLYGLTEQKEK